MQQRVKAIAEGRVGGYLVVWGDSQQRDLQGEYFTPESDLGLDWFPARPVLYHHGQDDHLKAAVIGVIDTLKADDTGIWAEAQLHLHQQYVGAVRRLIERGVLAWSSGSMPHLVEVADDGHIKRWPIVEGSLTPTPAEPRHTDVQTVKSAYSALGLDVGRLGIGRDESSTKDVVGAGLKPARTGADPDAENGVPTDRDDFVRYGLTTPDAAGRVPTSRDVFVGAAPCVGPHTPQQYQPTKSGGEQPPMENETNLKRLPVASREDAIKGKIEVSSPYDGLTALDMLHGYMLLRAAKSFQGVSERYGNALAEKVVKSGMSATKAAGDLSGTTITGFGDDWVPDVWSGEIWRKARQDNVVLPLFRSVEMPSDPFELPVEGADPTVYFVPETTLETQLSLGSGNTIPDSKVGSGKVTLDAGKLALRVGFSAELVEDAIVPVLTIYREQAVRAIADSIDYVLLNGDTEDGSTGNINTDIAAPNATDRFLVFDGLRKLPLVTTTANKVAMGNTPTLAKMRETRFKMAARYAARPSDLAWIVDGGTYAKLLDIEQFLTVDKAGALATAQTGQIGFIDGIPVFLSAEMPLTNSGGSITIGGTNDKGSAVCVYRPGWFVGYRRRIAVDVTYLPYYDAYQMTATVRLAFANVDQTNGDDVASLLYNITV